MRRRHAGRSATEQVEQEVPILRSWSIATWVAGHNYPEVLIQSQGLAHGLGYNGNKNNSWIRKVCQLQLVAVAQAKLPGFWLTLRSLSSSIHRQGAGYVTRVLAHLIHHAGRLVVFSPRPHNFPPAFIAGMVPRECPHFRSSTAGEIRNSPEGPAPSTDGRPKISFGPQQTPFEAHADAFSLHQNHL